jgi:hypothetical protein
MKICTVVLTYDTPLYNYFDNIKRAYLEQQQLDYFFVYNGIDNTKHNIPNKTYNYLSDIKHLSGVPVMFDKFIDIINSGLLDKYDYIARCNSSTFINVDAIRKKLTHNNMYMGFFYPNWNFISGACTIFSQDILKLLKENSHLVNKFQEDDVAIGELMNRLNIPKTYLDRYCFESHIQDTHITVPSDDIIQEAIKYPQIRIRNNSNRDLIDKGIWDKIANLVLTST